ncbi:phage integrase site specific recombinase [[Clostridium] sordellii]|nr:phage integrase site specific recombinase [[Clostridium] sordellii] [Paeniclostridium sordellii]
MKRAIKDYVEDKDTNDFLIKSRKNYNRPISRERAWRII